MQQTGTICLAACAILGVVSDAAHVLGQNLSPAPAEWRAVDPGGGAAEGTPHPSPGGPLFRRDPAELGVRGEGRGSAFWRSPELELAPGGTYSFRFRAAGRGSGLVISGPEGVNHDFRPPGDATDLSFAFRLPDDGGKRAFRLGQWELAGEVLFSDPQLYPVRAVHETFGPELELGAGESLEPGRYTDTHVLGWRGTTIHRTLWRQGAGFNTHRWTFGAGAEVVYRHAIPHDLIAARLALNLNYHAGGRLEVSASRDGERWLPLAEAGGIGAVEATFPAEVFPTRSLFVRLRGSSGPTSLQVDAYRLEAEVDYAGPRREGRTWLVEELLGSAPVPLPGQPGGPRLPALPPGNHTIAFRAEVDGETVSHARVEVTIGTLEERGYGRALPCLLGDVGALWWCEGARKVARGCPPPPYGPDAGPVTIEAARGEYEPAQLVIRGGPEGTTIEGVTAGDLRRGERVIPASAISLMEVATVRVFHPSDGAGGPGDYPDPLPPLRTPLRVPPGENQAIWVLVRVPEAAAAGDHDGAIRIETREGVVDVPLRVHVFDFALPKATRLRGGFGLSVGWIQRYHGLETDDQLRKVYELYLESFAEHRIQPYSFFDLDPIRVRWEGEGAERAPVVDFAAFDRAAARWIDAFGFNSFRLPLQGLGGGTFHSRSPGEFGGQKVGTSEYERLLGDYLRGVEGHLREKGWLDEAYVYWFDEPDPKDYPFVVDVMERLERHAPGLRRMLTEQPEKELLGHVEIWCGLTPSWTPEIVAERRRDGEEVWWYLCTGPKAPYVGLFIEHPAVEMRLWPWQSWQYGVQGILIWQTNWWTSPTAFPDSLQDPWADPMSYTSGYGVPSGTKSFWGNGDGRFFYPPRRDPNEGGPPVLEPPIVSLRWENLRDGVEDTEYLALLDELVRKAGPESPGARDARALLRIPEDISKDLTHFTTDPRPLLEHRRKVAAAIERLREGAARPTSTR